jgi:hypothetical protein
VGHSDGSRRRFIAALTVHGHGSRWLLALVIAGWSATVGGGAWALLRHASTPGAVADPPATWPAESRIARVPGLPTLLVFAHPQCACTRATFEELSRLLAQVPDRATASVLFARPAGAPASWLQSDIWAAAAAIPGVRAMADENETEAQRFGVATSGETMLYAADGTLVFHGGITGARGHAGDNAGRSTLTALLAGRTSERPDTPVFGCALRAPDPSAGTERGNGS